ncbi:MAG: hypothetical protein IJX14_10685 [Clostridia bacterium]|nr:hypothetical protein [Clostridia bacterium]
MQCYVFRTNSSLICHFTAPGNPITLQDTACLSRQTEFFNCLTAADTERFACFCRSKPKHILPPSSAAGDYVPSLLLFPQSGFASVFTERYTSQLLSRSDPAPGAIAKVLGQSPLQMLKERYPTNHLILSLLHRTLSDLYSTTSPILAHIPPLVRTLVSQLEQIHDPIPVISETLPCLRAYRTDLCTSDTPSFLDLTALLPRLTAWLPENPMFDGLQIQYIPQQDPPEGCQVRFSSCAFLYIFILLSYMMAVLSDDGAVSLDLHREDTYACVTLFGETDRLPLTYSARNELHSLSALLPRYAGLLTLLQYLLHRNRIPFSCRVCAPADWYGLECRLYLDTRYREEIEFHYADLDDQLAKALPDALSLLQLLLPDEPLT